MSDFYFSSNLYYHTYKLSLFTLRYECQFFFDKFGENLTFTMINRFYYSEQ